jgi:hypothetical protein
LLRKVAVAQILYIPTHTTVLRNNFQPTICVAEQYAIQQYN